LSLEKIYKRNIDEQQNFSLENGSSLHSNLTMSENVTSVWLPRIGLEIASDVSTRLRSVNVS
jgi:serine protease inhibitor